MVGVPDPKWSERPLLVVVPQPHIAGARAQGCCACRHCQPALPPDATVTLMVSGSCTCSTPFARQLTRRCGGSCWRSWPATRRLPSLR